MKINFGIFNQNYPFKPEKAILTTFVLAFLLSLCGVCFSAQPITSATEPKEKESLRPPRFRLVIKDFVMTGGDKKFNVLQGSLPELIALGLLDNESVEYISHEELLLAAAKKYPSEPLQKRQYFDNTVLGELKIDLIMTGNYFEYRGKIYITASLVNRTKKEEPKTFYLKPGTASEIYFGIKQFTDELNIEILSIAGKSVPQFAVLCFKDLSKEPSDSYKWFQFYSFFTGSRLLCLSL